MFRQLNPAPSIRIRGLDDDRLYVVVVDLVQIDSNHNSYIDNEDDDEDDDKELVFFSGNAESSKGNMRTDLI